MAARDPLIGTRMCGYLITDLIGRGGMGTVYRARDEEGAEEVALKVLPVAQLHDVGEADRFHREAKLAAGLDHPNIVSTFGSGSESGHLYIAMELVEGISLRQLLRREGRLLLGQTLSVAAQVLAGLEAAHGRQVVHRDIKAENVIIRQDGTAKILDFGVAKLESSAGLPQVNEILGTVEYMAPEQIRGDPTGPAADLYAAGVLIYEMLTGCLPFTGDSPAALVYRRLNHEPHGPSFLNPGLPRSLDRFVLRLLDRRPENRFDSTTAALAALGVIRRGQQTLAVPKIATEGLQTPAEEEMLSPDLQPAFVGRQPELERLRAPYDALGSGGGKTLFLAGEAGIGKTRLAEELALHAVRQGGWVIHGTCIPGHGHGPYVPVFDALGELFDQTASRLSEAERQGLYELLATEAPELAALAQRKTTTAEVRSGFTTAFGTKEDPEPATQRLFDAVFELLTLVASGRPLVLILEDMHWADPGSLYLLQHLTRRIGESRLLCLVTYRPEELRDGEPCGGTLAQVIGELASDGVLTAEELERLSIGEVAQLARSLCPGTEFPEDLVHFLYEESEGNPLIAVEVLMQLLSQDLFYCESGSWSAGEDLATGVLPARVSALVMRRLDRLDKELRELLQVAAVAGTSFTSQLLERVAGLPRISVLKVLSRLERIHRLITGTNGVYDFSHRKIREVLYQQTPRELRRECHRMLAAALYDLGETEPAVLGRHLYEAEEFQRAIPYLGEAAEMAFQRSDWRRSIALSAQVEEACRRTGSGVELLLDALRRSGLASSQLGGKEKALERFARMEGVAQASGLPAAEAEALIHKGREQTRCGSLDAATDSFARALACTAEEDGLLRGRAESGWGTVDLCRAQYREARQRWHRALELLPEDALVERGDALSSLAVVATVHGEFGRAWDLYEQVLALGADARPSPQDALTRSSMGRLRADQGHWEEALELCEMSLEICRQTGSWTHEPIIALGQAQALIGSGDLVAGRLACNRAMRGFRRIHDPLRAAETLCLYGRICRLERDWEEGRGRLRRSIDVNRQYGESVGMGEALYELGLLERDQGNAAAALTAVRQAEVIFARIEAAPGLSRARRTLAELEPEHHQAQ
jgi:tetratricopeptide (TPR) repeat protein